MLVSSVRASGVSKGKRMIIPLVAEDGWAPFLDQLPEWRPSSVLPLLIVVPHPDDEVLGVGGLIAALSAAQVHISVVAVTDGEHAYPDDPDAGLGILRSAEQTAALDYLGVPSGNILRLRFPDSDVMSQLPELVERLSALTSQHTQLFAPWRGDFHPDHAACGIAAEEVARRTGATLTSYFFWTWHRGSPDLLAELPLRKFPLSHDAFEAKTRALECHQSQLIRAKGEPILPPSLLGPARRPFEVFLVP